MEAQPLSEDQRVVNWRIEQFLRVGFSSWQATHLAVVGADWHLAEKIIADGCKLEHALVILEPAY